MPLHILFTLTEIKAGAKANKAITKQTLKLMEINVLRQ
jgi:hypothetical protein